MPFCSVFRCFCPTTRFQSDMKTLRVLRNGEEVTTLRGLKGIVYPAFYVARGTELECNFGGWEFDEECPPGFDGVMIEQSLIG